MVINRFYIFNFPLFKSYGGFATGILTLGTIGAGFSMVTTGGIGFETGVDFTEGAVLLTTGGDAINTGLVATGAVGFLIVVLILFAGTATSGCFVGFITGLSAATFIIGACNAADCLMATDVG
jgi:hypothetical protein